VDDSVLENTFETWEIEKKDAAVAAWKRFFSEVAEAVSKGEPKPCFPVVCDSSFFVLSLD
jgi:hypothetical protein